MCVYLLKMREYFRWEKNYAYGSTLPQKELGDWLTAREELWGRLEGKPFTPIEIDGRHHDPFDTGAINQALEAHRRGVKRLLQLADEATVSDEEFDAILGE